MVLQKPRDHAPLVIMEPHQPAQLPVSRERGTPESRQDRMQQATGQAQREAHLRRRRSEALRLIGTLLTTACRQDGGVDHIRRRLPLRQVHVVGQRGLLCSRSPTSALWAAFLL